MKVPAGGITGAIEISITYPTEYTKTVMQLYPEINKKGAIECVRSTVKNQGIFGMYRGYSALLLFSVPKNSVRFGTFNYMKTNVLKDPTKLNNFTCGLMAGAAESTFVVTPQETLKTKLIHDKLSENPKYKNLFQGIYKITAENGIAGLYRGYLPTLIKQSTNQGVRFVVFEDSQKYLSNYIKTKVLCDVLAGGFAGFCSVMFNNPVDVVKTNMQGLEAAKYGGFLGCFAYIMKHEGVFGFYKGVGPRMARVILDVAITFSVFNSIKRLVTKILIRD